MDKDIEFCLAVLKYQYDDLRQRVVEGNLPMSSIDSTLTDLEKMLRGIVKIENTY